MPLSWASAYCVLPFVLSHVNNVPGTELSYIAHDDDGKHQSNTTTKIKLASSATGRTENNSWKTNSNDLIGQSSTFTSKKPLTTFCSAPWCVDAGGYNLFTCETRSSLTKIKVGVIQMQILKC